MDIETLNWINNETMRNQEYHNHKENMSWVATVLYTSSAFLLGSQLKGVESWKLALGIIMWVVVTGLAYFFVYWQFKHRKIAAERVRSLIEIVKNELKDIDKAKLLGYFTDVEKRYRNPNETMLISFLIMGIAFTAYILLLSCW
jgi:hypothetical protein